MKHSRYNNSAIDWSALRMSAKALFVVSLILVIFSSCKDDQPIGPEESSKDRIPELNASAQDLDLQLINFNTTAVEFSWSPGSNHGTNSAIDYTLEFGMKGDNFESPVSVPLGRAVYSRAYTVSEFNGILREQMEVEPETTADLEVRLKSSTADSAVEPDYSNVVEVSATPYRPVTNSLYIIGSAAPNGWDANNAEALDQDADRPFVFTYSGQLSTGEFKFITTLGQFLPSYNRGASDTELFYRSEESQPDEPFVIDEPGTYKVTANLAEMTIAIEKQEGPSYNKLWVVGSAVPTGWSLDEAPQMRQHPGDPFIFDYNEVLSEGEFKIATALDFNAPFYRPTTNYPDLSNEEVQLNAGDPDHKWYISDPGPYKITFNMREMTISIEKFTPYSEIWMVGDATPNGWNIDDPNQMTQDPDNEYVFTYEGQLSTGEFKFPLSTGDWGADFFMPGIQHQPIDSSYVQFVPGGTPDLKWNISEAGTYSIRLNQLYETIEITKQ